LRYKRMSEKKREGKEQEKIIDMAQQIRQNQHKQP